MRVLVTGLGLVGSWVVRHLAARGHVPTVFDIAPPGAASREIVGADQERFAFVQGDVTDLPDLIRAVEESGSEAIIHTASLLTEAVRRRPYAGLRINLLGTVNVFEAARLRGAIRVVFCSSSTVYTGVWERYLRDVVPADFEMHVLSERPRSVYASAKLAAEWLGLNYLDAGYLDFVALRLQGVIGPWAAPLSGIPGRLIKMIAETAADGRDVRITEPTVAWRGVEEFVHASDAAMAAVLAAEASDPSARVYSIGMGRAYTVDEVLDTARRVFPGVRIELEATPQGGIAGYPMIRRQACDSADARRDLGYVPAYDMERTIGEYASWLRREPGGLPADLTALG